MFFNPPLSSQAEIDSFDYQSPQFNTTTGPDEKTRKRILQRMEEVFSSSQFNTRTDFASRAHIRDVLQLIEKKSGKKSPGAIFLREGLATNDDVFRVVGLPALVERVHDRIEQLLAATDEEAKYISDPIRIFIKREPHSLKKKTQKRWRLIWGISLIDQAIDRILYGEMVDAALDNHDSTPNKPGFNFKYGGVNRLVTQYETGRRTWRSFDAKSFDITASGWALSLVLELNVRLNRAFGPARDKWEALARKREQASLFGSFVFSNGVVCRKILPGIQPSGRFTTIDSNGKLMGIFRCWWDIEKGVPTTSLSWLSMGDDSVQDGIDDVDAFLEFHREKCGVTLTVESEPGLFSDQNFCSFKMHKLKIGFWVPISLNWEKNTYKLANPEESSVATLGESLLSLCVEYAFHPRFDELHRLLGEYFPAHHRSRDWCRLIVTGFEKSA